MENGTEKDGSRRQRAQARIIAPVRGTLRRAALLSVAAGLIWPIQAVLIAWIVSVWVAGAADNTLPAIAGFVVLGIVRGSR